MYVDIPVLVWWGENDNKCGTFGSAYLFTSYHF